MINNRAKFDREKPAGFDGVFDWDYLLPAFPRNIQPMDWDAVVEISRRFLVFETKDLGVTIPVGQQRALEAAVRTGYFTVIVCLKSASQIRCYEVWALDANRRFQTHPVVGDAESLRSYIARWAQWANHGQSPFSIPPNDGRLLLDYCTQCGQPLKPFEIL